MRLTEDNLEGLIKKIAVPSSIGFLFNTLFNIVDTYFVGFINVEALAALSLSFPVFFILLSIGSGIGTGVSALVSNLLGEKKYDEAFKVSENAITLSFIVGALITILGLTFDTELFSLMGGRGKVLEYGLHYTKWIFIGAVFFVINMILNGILTAQGNTKTYRNFLIFGVMLNIILDPIFIFYLKMGTGGVAIATVLVQIVGNVYLYSQVKKSRIFCKRKYILKKPNWKPVYDILEQGIPASFSMMSIALGVFVINYFVNKQGGDSAIAAYGIAVRLEQLALLPAIGLNTAALTLSGQNFGARNFERVEQTYKKTLKYGLIIMTTAMVLVYPIIPYFFGLFTHSKEVLDYGYKYFRIEIFCFNSYVFLNIADAVLRGLKHPKFPIVVGVYRQILMPLILIPLLIKLLNNIYGIWIGILLINWSAAVIVSLYLFYIYKKEKLKENKQ